MQWDSYRKWHKSVLGATALQHQREGRYGMQLTCPRSQLLTALCSSQPGKQSVTFYQWEVFDQGYKIHDHRSFSVLTKSSRHCAFINELRIIISPWVVTAKPLHVWIAVSIKGLEWTTLGSLQCVAFSEGSTFKWEIINVSCSECICQLW